MSDEARLASLTPTERDVTRLVCRGLTNPQIAAELGVSARTIQTHLRATFRKLRVSSRTELAVVATRAMDGRA